MNSRNHVMGVTAGWVLVIGIFSSLTAAQEAQKMPYMDAALPADQRAADLVHRMTLEEKAQQMVNQARAVPRLQIPAYDWWSEALHGVLADGTTNFPEPIGLGATFDPAAVKTMGEVISTEGRIKHVQAARAGHSNIFEGLDFWAPNINIFRDPRWGRGQETYGEDPFLTAHMGVAYITGVQGDDSRYYRGIATPKHYAVHSGPESTRHTANVTVSKHDEMDTYLPAFRAAITDGNAGSIMCAYNSINGEPACANSFLLQDQLRTKWHFKGYVVSDCGAVTNVFAGHHYRSNYAEAAAVSVQRGMDNDCADLFTKINDDHDYKPYLDAVRQGLLPEASLDTAVTRLFTARIKLGLFDPVESVSYNKIDEKLLDSAQHRALARRLANESMVLLKNDGILPLKTSSLKIAVVGPLANQTKFLQGNYSGSPSHTVSILEGIKAEFPSAQISFVQGTQYLSKEASPFPPDLITTDGTPGVRVTYLIADPATLLGLPGPPPTILTSRIEPTVGASGLTAPPEIANKEGVLMSSDGTIAPQETGDYNLGLGGTYSFFRISLDDKPISLDFSLTGNGENVKLARVHFEKGKTYKLNVTFPAPSGSTPAPQFLWAKLDPNAAQQAIAAAKAADVVIAIVGITSELEGEEMPTSEEGFSGGDRTSIDLPRPEEDLLKSMAGTGKPLIAVLVNGSALGVSWANEHANAILESWYAGEEGGAAVAETISGRNNPGGKLPVTFYKSVSQLPQFDDYSMKGRTYRYFEGAPLYPFGYGLSYSHFNYKDIHLVSSTITAGEPLEAEATVTNAGRVVGDEVVQLYLTFPDVPGAPRKALRGFQRLNLGPGASQVVRFKLGPRDLSMVTEAGDPLIPEGDFTVSIGGGQPKTNAPSLTAPFHVKGRILLPE